MNQIKIALEVFRDKANLLWAAVLAVLTQIFGKALPVFGFFLLLNIVDFYYGRKKARKTDTLSSRVGAEGIGKKVSYWVMIGLAFGVSCVFVDIMGPAMGVNLGFLRLIGWFTLGVYILNELTSIIENMMVLGYDVPAVLVRGLAAARSVVDEAGNKIAPGKESGEAGLSEEERDGHP